MAASFRHILWKTSLPLVLFMCGIVCAQAQSPQIGGYVRSAVDQHPLQATVCLFAATSANTGFVAVEKAATDGKGQYTFSVKVNTPYKLVVYPMDANFATTYYPDMSDLQSAAVIVYNQNQTSFNFDLKAKQVNDNGIRGHVQNTSGAAVDATIILQSTSGPNSQSYTVMTDKLNAGSFDVKGIEAGQYLLQAVPMASDLASGYYRLNAPATHDASLATVVTVSQSGYASPEPVIILDSKVNSPMTYGLKGIVIDEFKQPIANALISVFDVNGKSVSGNAGVVSAADGSFNCTINGTPGTYVVTAQCKGYDDVVTKVIIDDKNAVVFVTVIMTSNDQTVYDNAIIGRVQDLNNAPLPAKVMALKVLADGSVATNSAQTVTESLASDGTFKLTNLHPGTYVLYATPESGDLSGGYYVADKAATENVLEATHIDVSDQGSNTSPYVIRLDKNTRIYTYDFYAMVVDDNQAPLADVEFSALDAAGNEVFVNQLTLTDASGFIHLTFPGPGTYIISATKTGYQDGAGTITFSSAQWAQKAYIVLAKINGTKGGASAQIVAGVNDEISTVDALYPQPASETLSLRLQNDASVDGVSIYNMQGSLQLQSTLITAASTQNISISRLAAGCYELRVYAHGVLKGAKLFVKE